MAPGLTEFGDELAAAVAAALGSTAARIRPVGGGDASSAYALTLADGDTVFVKTSSPTQPAGRAQRFVAEAAGLAFLAETATVRVPEVRAVGEGTDGATPFLALEWIEPDAGAATAGSDEQLGRQLAALHASPCARFGLDRDNDVGLLPQDNTPEADWPTFYARRRVEPLARRAIDGGALPPSSAPAFDRLCERMAERTGPAEPPSRLHGDLWAGNVLSGPGGEPVLVDPAAYGGHREVDLAMMRLFGGFGPRAFAAYDDAHPLAAGHDERVPLYQLYPLLVHTILFGGAYADATLGALQRCA
jgi:fructosamine-3-kinase